MSLILRHGVIRDVWLAVFGDDPAKGHSTATNQHRVLCPFHAERDPSCDVHFEKNTFICRSCGAAGGALDVVVREGNAKNRSTAITWLKEQGVSLC